VGANPNPAKTFSVTFPKAGTYNYLCLFHPPNMKGTVVVQPAGTPYPQTQQQITPAGTEQVQAAVAKGQGVLPSVNKISQARLADGSTNWTVPAGVGTLDSAILRFGAPLSVKVGDTVTWVDQDPATPHTVTFTPGGQPLAPQDEPGPLSSLVGGNTYGGNGLFSSGLLGPIPGLKQSYSLKFTAAGTFQYRCLLHDDEGMVASITVTGGAPVQAPVQAPLP
jgi:plastocyanin